MRFLLLPLLATLLFGASHTEEKQKIMDKELQNAIAQEKKFAQEQKFYMGDEYDLSGAEVNPDSLKHVKELENLDDFDMDDVYD